jgi:hypothetical protein
MKKTNEYSREELWENKALVQKIGLHKRSVTPTTLEKVIFDDSEENLFYKEIYKYKNNTTVHFAIRDLNIKDFNFSEEKDFKDFRGNKEKLSMSGKTEKFKIEVNKIQLNSFEKNLLKDAVNDLLSDDSKKTVLLDIFARTNGEIKLDNEGNIETHTVVLYKNPPINIDEKYEIVVIDPSNFRFSSHLANPVNFNFIKNEKFAGINVSYDNKQIYTPGKLTGSNPNQYRDCIDIAIKIAFGINTKPNIDLANLAKLDAIQEITNQQEINLNLPFNSNVIARIKQATDNDIRKLTNKLLVNIDKQTKSISVYQDLEELILNKNYKTFDNLYYKPDDYKKGISDLLELNCSNDKIFDEYKNKINTDLCGEVQNYIEGD